MKLVIQRVNKANVTVKGKEVGNIGKGLVILVGVGDGDTKQDAEYLAEKVSKLRIMSDDEGKMNLSVKDVYASILAISQFTLYADTSKGNRPSFIKAAKPERANEVYEHFVSEFKPTGIKVETGKFGEYMAISMVLDGPVTIILNSNDK